MKRALISVSDKRGVAELARALAEAGYQILSTGGTAAHLTEAGLAVLAVSDVTGFPECLDGRVKTLHPRIHAGVLAKRDRPDHLAQLRQLDIQTIDILVINLYPFRQTWLQAADQAACLEQIDIGGPTLLRAGAKNCPHVTVVVDPDDYGTVVDQLREGGETTAKTRLGLARKAFEHTASYDALIAAYFASLTPEQPAALLTQTYERITDLRYGENPHQAAAYYRELVPVQASFLPGAQQLNGKELSYNNLADTDAAVALLNEFDEPTVVAVKHANPCGVASADQLLAAWQKAYEADPVSIYGGIVAMNRTVDLALAEATRPVFLEVLIAPDFTTDALALLAKRKNLRVLQLPHLARPIQPDRPEPKAIQGGLLVQAPDRTVLSLDACRTVTRRAPRPDQLADLVFAMKVVKHTKSNAIVLAANRQTVGIGPGQPNRVTSVAIALERAGDRAAGAVLASDAFFPFDDWVESAAQAGVQAVIQPGGSIRDQASIEACDQAGLAMVFTGVRHFRH